MSTLKSTLSWLLPFGSSAGSTTTTLNIAHFNDVYQVSEHKVNGEAIDVTKFATLLEGITTKWKNREDGKKDGLIVFSGDLFSPSIESSITKGKHMLPIINAMNVDIAVVGNHEFDFGYPELTALLGTSAFPWLLSNIIDTNTGKVPEPLREFHVLERAGVRIGLIGLVEEDWIPTIVGWPENFEFKDMAEVARSLSVKLRDPAGEYKCDIIIALTHSRIANDITLAKEVFALSPTAQASKDISTEHGVDLLLGGHDHIYWISKGVTEWNGYDVNIPLEDAQEDLGDVLVVKSGTDFQDLTDIVLTLRDAPPESVRRKIIQEIRGKRYTTKGETPVHKAIKDIYDKEVKYIEDSLKEPICIIEEELDTRSSYIRTQEAITDCQLGLRLRSSQGYGKADGTLSNSGDIRGDRVYSPGRLSLGDLKTMFPYNDSVVVMEVDGKTLWEAMESGLSRWPSQEGRFPSIAGFRVEWDSRREPGQRVLGIWLLEESSQLTPNGTPILVDKEPVARSSDRKYLIVTGEYLANGGDGYTMLKDQKLVINAENGQPKNQLVKKFLGGLQLLNRDSREGTRTLDSLKAGQLAAAAFSAADHKRVGLLDPYERSRAQKHLSECTLVECAECALYGLSPPLEGAVGAGILDAKQDVLRAAGDEGERSLPVIRPFVDGRLRDVAKM
ncbi:hypothetical protein CC1G_11855 [Coprinopsis cinerea okayama7|uniref:Metallo-dependent phosphatase n=1 Tax=Coprinopsis cinerea (strain Okayama-7 / 130 / ATCC MYA-4618 / FGSC 9003) TaxID=240176 RepID=A8PH26_COPC7|nr:hypothetical protein CC1G_11855 [Coprinopsis cinerea okayama7\|eukprot:XP_001841327.2 hypothetical protein CC1G_11855 [Coprinopsis cinerea okayama7\